LFSIYLNRSEIELGRPVENQKSRLQLTERRSAMGFEVGDKVVHRSYGSGEIVQLDRKELSGRSALYYVVKIRDLTLWVPASDNEVGNLRPPTPAAEFKQLFTILTSPGEPLPEDRLDRKQKISDLMKAGTLESICRVICDLNLQQRTKKLNENDLQIMERARQFLLSEWQLAFSVTPQQAERELNELLAE
jgi:RNA polymerase-interacting CarD/CdnL/TRCF family regulator